MPASLGGPGGEAPEGEGRQAASGWGALPAPWGLVSSSSGSGQGWRAPRWLSSSSLGRLLTSQLRSCGPSVPPQDSGPTSVVGRPGARPSHNRERLNSALPPLWGAGVEERGVGGAQISKSQLTGPRGPGTLCCFCFS